MYQVLDDSIGAVSARFTAARELLCVGRRGSGIKFRRRKSL
jgi:hypothetical protein